MMGRAQALFAGHPGLAAGFSVFLPPGVQMAAAALRQASDGVVVFVASYF